MFSCLVLLTVLLLQSPVRFGSVSQTLTTVEVAEIEALVSPEGRRAWLIRDDPGHPFALRYSRGSSIWVYLHADSRSARLRRGHVLQLAAETPAVAPTAGRWRASSKDRYAYVVPSTPSTPTGSFKDPNWPFLVDEGIDDNTLLSLVAFHSVRSAAGKGSLRPAQWDYAHLLRVHSRRQVHGPHADRQRGEPDGHPGKGEAALDSPAV